MWIPWSSLTDRLIGLYHHCHCIITEVFELDLGTTWWHARFLFLIVLESGNVDCHIGCSAGLCQQLVNSCCVLCELFVLCLLCVLSFVVCMVFVVCAVCVVCVVCECM